MEFCRMWRTSLLAMATERFQTPPSANKKGPASLLNKGKQGLLLYAGVVPQAGQNVRLPGVSYAFGPGFGFSVEPSVTSVIRSGNPPSG